MLVLVNNSLRGTAPRIFPKWHDITLLPVYLAAVSLLLLLASFIWKTVARLRARSAKGKLPLNSHANGDATELEVRAAVPVAKAGAWSRFLAWTRFIACLGLLNLATGPMNIPQSLFYIYIVVLALVSLFAKTRSKVEISQRHLSVLLFASFAVRVYLDLWPLAQYHPVPPEYSTPDWYIQTRLVLLTYAAVFVPLFIPRVHAPVDPENPLPPSPEQTASLFSLLFFMHMDPLVWKASTHAHLPYDELPPLADLDHSAYFRATSFPLLDPTLRKSQRHIFFAFVRVYAKYFFSLTVSIVAFCLSGFIAPVAIYQLLHYVETGGEGATIKPWFWVGALFFKSIFGSMSDHWYLYEATKFMVRTEGIITQLVFEHALRIRLKEDAASAPEKTSGAPSSTTTTAPQTPVASAGTLPPTDLHDASAPSTTTATSTQASVATASTKTPSTKEEGKKDEHKGSNLIGKINNLISSDLDNLTEGRDLPYVFAFIPLKIALSVWFLYVILGWSVFVGVAFMIVGFYIPGRLAAIIHAVQVERMKRTDDRVQSITEIVGLLRLVKMFGWETRTENRLRDRRERELESIRKYFLYNLMNNNVTWILPLITLLATYATFTLIMKQPLTASKVFSSLGVLESLREAMYMMLQYVPMLVTAKVSLDRVDDFLRNTELLDAHSKEEGSNTARNHGPINEADRTKIGFHNAHFTWSAGAARPGDATPSRREFILRLDGDITFVQGGLNLIVGPTASGKSSLLLALLGELHFNPTGFDSWYNLPREGGVSYCAQESWVMNQTIKDNIIFGQEFDEARYKQVLYECALNQDLTLFEAGDATEVGERGLTLSGGQKARVSLARAVYSNSSIVLLDDILSALDVHTIKWIVDKCLSGKLLKGRTVILVTHNLSMTGPIAKRVISLSSHGVATVNESTGEAISHDHSLVEEESVLEKDELDDAVDEDDKALEVDPTPAKGKLIADEEVALGHVSLSALMMYFRGMGGPLFWSVFLVTCGSTDIIDLFQTWWLGKWAAQYDIHDDHPEEVSVVHYLGIYAAAVLAGALVFSISQFFWIGGVVRAARSIHERLTRAILNTTMRFLDKTPVGRIIQRFTKDIAAVDTTLSRTTHNTIQLTLHLIQRLIVIVIFSPAFLIPGVVLLLLGGIIGQLYIRTQLPVKREMSNSRAPVFSHFGASINGLTSIRAYGAQEAFKNESLKRIDKYTRTARPFWNLNRWIGMRIDFIGGLFSTSLAGYLVYYAHSSASDIGFLLNCSLWFTELLLYWIRELNEVEVQGNSLERIQQYVEIEQEDVPTEAGKPPAYWPTSGRLSVERLSARYTVDGPDVLHDLTFECRSGDKIGIVGRTGSGKSSLTLSLLRLIPTSGEVYFDGLPTSTMNLDSLRGAITIIPQQPELMSGSIRENLDPFGEHEDVELNDALRSAGLFNLQEDLAEEERVSLDTMVSSSGGNFSLGQRQIIALARALVRRSRVLILDEATASMDHKTDALIQVSLRTQFKDCTVITIAHRLHTIMDLDKVLVLDSGHLEEYDSPRNLLAKKSGTFKAMVDGSGDRNALYALTA